jgi:hypothetical protein
MKKTLQIFLSVAIASSFLLLAGCDTDTYVEHDYIGPSNYIPSNSDAHYGPPAPYYPHEVPSSGASYGPPVPYAPPAPPPSSSGAHYGPAPAAMPFAPPVPSASGGGYGPPVPPPASHAHSAPTPMLSMVHRKA